MRDYQKVAMLIYHDESLEPGAQRFLYFFNEVVETQSWWQVLQGFNPNYKADLLGFRWIGWDKASIVQVLNDAYRSFSNYQLFIDGYDGISLGLSPVIFVESPRSDGFNSLTEEPL